MNLRFVKRSSGPLQQPLEVVFGRVEGAGEILALGRFEVQRKHQLVFGAPVGFVEQPDALLKVITRRTIGGRGLVLASCYKIQVRKRKPLRGTGDEIAADVHVIENREDSIVWDGRVEVDEQQSPQIEMDWLLVRFRNQAVGGLLHAVV